MRPALLGALLAGCASPADTPAARLSWMVGSWQEERSELRTVEAWRAMPDGSLLGSGFAQQGAVMVFAETLAIQREGGRDVYTAWPAGQDPVAFPLASSGEQEVTFANEAHDFPKRITYRLAGPDELAVSASGDGDAGPRTEAWSLMRAR